MQGDGNLVIYSAATNKPVWSAGVVSANPGKAIIQGDGNLVLYDAANVAYWASNTDNKGAAPYKLVLQVRRRSVGISCWTLLTVLVTLQ
jgi:hypothetical protein